MSDADDFLTKPQERLHVYQVPEVLSDGYAFGGGNPVAFLNVDFFDVPWDLPRADIVTFIKGKRYFKPASRFLVLSSSKHPTLTFTIEPALSTGKASQ